MSLLIKFYFTSSMLDMFRTLIHPSSGAVSQAQAVLQPATRIPLQPATRKLQHTSKQEHTIHRIDTIGKSQAPDDGCINVRNMLSIEEIK